MKKLFAIVICVILICSNVGFAEENQKITDKLSEIWLSPENDVQVLENIKKSNEAKIEELINLYLIAPGYAREKIGISADDEKMKTQVNEKYAVKENDILKTYYMLNTDYAGQYAEKNSFRYLISEENYWTMKTGGFYRSYAPDGMWYNSSVRDNVAIGLNVITDDGLAFLKNTEEMDRLLSNINISEIKDIKFLVMNGYCSCLYIDCSEKEYLVRVYEGFQYEPKNMMEIYDHDSMWTKNLEMYKLYDAKELLSIISEDTNEMNSVKPTYETEALSLQESGLLQGNENGLDLLKPLSRAEAATMLLRAMGESTTSETQVQTFSDVPSSHWSYGAVENAYNLGLIEGIGDNLFAPEDNVTAEQFSTMILRASEYGEFDWKEALNILISKDVITSEEAETMDFFTRGDMAKIICESIEKGLF